MMMDALVSRSVFLALFSFLSAFYVLLKLRLARPRPRAEPVGPFVPAQVLETSQDPDALAAAIEEVARTLDRRAVDPLGRLLAHHDPRIAAAAANVLGLIGDERALGYLFASVGRLEQELATDGPYDDTPPPPLPDEDPPDLPELTWPDPTQGKRILDQYAKPGDAAIGLVLSLLALATDREAEPQYRYFALKNLELILPDSPVMTRPPGASQGPAPEQLARDLGILLADPSASIRYAAVSVLEVVRIGEVADYLEGALSDPNQHVRARACMALAGVSPARARKHLFSLLSDADPQVRRAAQRTLEELDRN